MMTATYSPDDNKLRLYSSTRLDAETFARVKAAGFKWAPRQELFVAPMWTPGREDLLVELCGEVGDEDTSLVDRAEERAERFEEYSEKRAADAASARQSVEAITQHIPFGQPILVGHHSERRARKDAERIGNGMRKAVKMWETSRYWQDRAAGALRHAKYKELPGVRHRRIKKIESERRTAEKSIRASQSAIEAWQTVTDDLQHAMEVADSFSVSIRADLTKPDYSSAWSLLRAGTITPAAAKGHALKAFERSIAKKQRWLAHYDNRLTYERAMLAEAIGGNAEGGPATMGDRFKFEKGGRVLVGSEWLVVLKINKAGDQINSITTSPPRSVTWQRKWVVPVEDVNDYKEPTADDKASAEKATKLLPLCNYPGEGFLEMTQAEWKRAGRHSDSYFVRGIKGTETAAAHRVRFAPAGSPSWRSVQVFITDAKRVDPPACGAAAEPVTFARQVEDRAPRPIRQPQEPNAYDHMRESLRNGGVQVVTAPQLFPTPAGIIAQMIEHAGIAPGDSVLEPSAGTGDLAAAILASAGNAKGGEIGLVLVEINHSLATALRARFANLPEVPGVICKDFLECDGLGVFDVILMNPPFANAADIRHIEHAASMLKPGGRLVAICANGPRQNERLKPQASYWEALPPGSFRDSGTEVNAAILVIQR